MLAAPVQPMHVGVTLHGKIQKFQLREGVKSTSAIE
jgi:hypothetical protein